LLISGNRRLLGGKRFQSVWLPADFLKEMQMQLRVSE